MLVLPVSRPTCSSLVSLSMMRPRFVRGHIRHEASCVESKAEGVLAIHGCGQFLKGGDGMVKWKNG